MNQVDDDDDAGVDDGGGGGDDVDDDDVVVADCQVILSSTDLKPEFGLRIMIGHTRRLFVFHCSPKKLVAQNPWPNHCLSPFVPKHCWPHTLCPIAVLGQTCLPSHLLGKFALSLFGLCWCPIVA